MARLNLKTVEARVGPLSGRSEYDREFLFELLDAYGKPQSSITRLRKGSLNVAADPEVEVAQKGVVYFREVAEADSDLLLELELLRTAPHVVKFNPRFVIVTDYHQLLAHDSKTSENLITDIAEINKHFTFFLPWAGMEKAQYTAEAHADVKAAEKMGKLFDELKNANESLFESANGSHSLNVFFTRLLFCFFAEDTGVFEEGQFTKAVASHTLADGSDVQEFLIDLFDALDADQKTDVKPYLADFPYVNGSLFRRSEILSVPRFTKKAREELIALGTLMWQEINPDIFGSMFQAIVSVEQRAGLGQHYTSVPNILKTIDPLFMDELREQFNKHYDSVKGLEALHDRISAIKVFDPACGSGNFLVIAYKELRKLEHAILARLEELDKTHSVLFTTSRINIENFYGIEIEDFASEIAVLSMWIAKHQMNREFKSKFGVDIPLIPLKESGNIHVGNAARVDWELVCPHRKDEEVYLISNPPYVGSSMQSKEQKGDFEIVFAGRNYSKKLDYISLWFVKGTDYIRGSNAKLAFVTTNSVSQGDHVALLFPTILSGGIEIGFAYTSFKWENNAKGNAGVTVAVIGLRPQSTEPKFLFQDDIRHEANNINPYLIDGPDVVVEGHRLPLSKDLVPMTKGSQPTDGGYLLLNEYERHNLIADSPAATPFLKKFIGSEEHIKDIKCFCIWVQEESVEKAEAIPEIALRLHKVANKRNDSSKAATRKFAALPYRFTEIRYKPTDSIIVPSVSSERRHYVPIGYLGPDTVISNAAFAIYDAEPWLFALLTSKMHMVWLRAVGGKLKTDYRYSNTLVYNTFPVPELTADDKETLTEAALRVLDVREYHAGSTLAELYDPDKMPRNLREAHSDIDGLVDRLFAGKLFETDEERLALLFKMYEEQLAADQLQATNKPPARKRNKK